MTLEEMRKIADERSNGPWYFKTYANGDLMEEMYDWYIETDTPYQIKICSHENTNHQNGKFIAMAANNWDYIFELASQCSFALDQLKKEQEVSQKMMAVIEAAQKVIEIERYYYVERNLPYPTFYTKYFKALQEMEEL